VAIAFYISGHGFGHASRQVEIINALGRLTERPLILRTAVSPDLLARTLRVPYQLASGPCDTGIVQATSVSHDDPATVAAADEFYRTYDDRIAEEARRLAAWKPHLIVGDIPPLAFSVATRLGIPAVAIGNFTWDWIYEAHPGFLPGGARHLDRIREAYRGVDLALELPFSGGFEVFPRVERLPLVARRSTRNPLEARAHFGLPRHARVALLTFGGYGLPALDLAAIDCRDEWLIVTTDRVSAPDASALRHVRLISEQVFLDGDFRYEDLVAAADVVVTKPGYGIIAECISTGTAMLYTSRGIFREYDVLVSALPGVVRSRFISHADLFAGRWRTALEGLLAQPKPETVMPANGAEVAAQRISEISSSSS
jgi:hypothetical protein